MSSFAYASVVHAWMDWFHVAWLILATGMTLLPNPFNLQC
jgi:hypothetical protein